MHQFAGKFETPVDSSSAPTATPFHLHFILKIKQAGITSLCGIATALNNRCLRTARGGQWQVSNVRNLTARTPEEPLL
jgi:hypothetical protein